MKRIVHCLASRLYLCIRKTTSFLSKIWHFLQTGLCIWSNPLVYTARTYDFKCIKPLHIFFSKWRDIDDFFLNCLHSFFKALYIKLFKTSEHVKKYTYTKRPYSKAVWIALTSYLYIDTPYAFEYIFVQEIDIFGDVWKAKL